MMQKRYIIGGVLVIAAIAALVYFGFQYGTIYYYTIAELRENTIELTGEEIRVTGRVAENSMEWDGGNLTLRFTLVDEEESLPIVYHDVMPDNFQEGRDIVVDGIYYEDGVFIADEILTKCPSKYVPRE